jgi:hypothetical protein
MAMGEPYATDFCQLLGDAPCLFSSPLERGAFGAESRWL